MCDNGRRLIEDYLPIQAISAEASREKSVRKGHISTLHLWRARPLSLPTASTWSWTCLPRKARRRQAGRMGFRAEAGRWSKRRKVSTGCTISRSEATTRSWGSRRTTALLRRSSMRCTVSCGSSRTSPAT
ncbi:MAG: hypothetical protein C4B57_08250 [Deltaproteobacteria bacterium]|nr:MAG: hypothetical protein C4B57_08250 [Deltaproteobacteria bacterium]